MSFNVLVTGGASGLGKALALRYAKAGAQVCISDINPDAAAEVVKQIENYQGQAFFIPCDITQQQDVDQLQQVLSEKWQHLDVLVNNAGVATAGSLEFEDIEQWQWVMNINLIGMVRMTKSFAPMLRPVSDNARTPSIVNIASQAGITPIPMMASYNASKAAVVSFSETMHLELAREGIHVSVACPSFFNTNLDKSLRSNQPGADKLVKKMLTRSDIDADQVADIIFQGAEKQQFMIITHKQGRAAHRLKRLLPTRRYLNMIKQKTRSFGVNRDPE